MTDAAATGDTFSVGMAIVIGFVFFAVLCLAVLDVGFELAGWPSIGYRVEHWSIENPWFAAGVLLVVGMFLAHFVLNPLCPDDLAPNLLPAQCLRR